MARMPKEAAQVITPPPPISKLDRIEELLGADSGATIAEMMAATGWLSHSVRGALAGALKKRGLVIQSEKADGIRRYRATRPA
jgi:hypothetical protein